MWRESDVPRIREIVRRSGFAGRRSAQFFRAHAGAELHHFLEHRHHRPRHVRRNHVGNLRARLPRAPRRRKRSRAGCSAARCECRHRGNTVNAEVCSINVKSAAPSASGRYGGNGLVMPNRAQLDHVLHSHVIQQPHRGNIARIRQRPPQRDAPFEFLVVILRRVILPAAAERYRRIHNRVEWRKSLLTSASAYTYTLNELPVCRSAWVARLNFDSSKSYPPTIALISPRGIVNRQQCALRRRGCLFQLRRALVIPRILNRYATTSPTFTVSSGDFMPSPRNRRSQPSRVRPDFDGREWIHHASPVRSRSRPSRRVRASSSESYPSARRCLLHDIAQIAAPTVAPVVFMQAVAHRLIGGSLHRDVQRRVHAQSLLVHRGGAVGALEVLADFFHEIRREIIPRRFGADPAAGSSRPSPAPARILPFCGHVREHQVASR